MIETCKLDAIDPHAYLAYAIAKIVKIVNGHPNSQIDDLLTSAYVQAPDLKAMARESA